jgi:uncharacterized protein YlxW (UPF0749 family)
MRRRVLYLLLGIVLLANLVIVAGVVAAVVSPTASERIASRLHLAHQSEVQRLQLVADDLDTRVSDLETSVGDTSEVEDVSSRLDDLESRLDDLETGAGDAADQSVSDLSSSLDDLNGRMDDVCSALSYGC